MNLTAQICARNVSALPYCTINCSTVGEIVPMADAKGISAIKIVTSSLSVLGSVSIILSVLLTGRLNNSQVHPLFMLSLGDFVVSMCWLVGGVVWLTPGVYGWGTIGGSTHTGMCYILGIGTLLAEMVTFLLTTVYAITAMMLIMEIYYNKGMIPMDGTKKRIRHIVTIVLYFISWILPPAILLPATEGLGVGLVLANSTCICSVDFYNLRPENGYYDPNPNSSGLDKLSTILCGYSGLLFVITFLIITVCYILTFVYAQKVSRNYHEGRHVAVAEATKRIRAIKYRLTLFVVIFVITGIPSIVAAVMVIHEQQRLNLHESKDKITLYFQAMLAPLQGIANAILYGWSREEFRKSINLSLNFGFFKRNSSKSMVRYQPAKTGASPHKVIATVGAAVKTDDETQGLCCQDKR
ncbi:hypothetical protein EMCRGX_G023907 [Ephydatia muelleri]|eukprot:Em0015g138a